MADLHLLFNHVLTKEQIREAEDVFRVKDVYTLPPRLSALWAEVSPRGELDKSHLAPIERWLTEKAQEGDYVLVQGECGATFYMVDLCFKRGLVPIYATTDHPGAGRGAHHDDHVVRGGHFGHVNFRRYSRYDD